MTRDRRQRANRRRDRRTDGDSGHDLVRSDVPGALDHASGDVDEFDAALIRGAGGVPMPAEQQDEEGEEREERESRRAGAARATEQADRELGERAGQPAGGGRGGSSRAGDGDGGSGNGSGGGGGGGTGGGSGEAAFGRPAPRAHPAPRRSILGKAVAFLRASWAELQRVQWPDRREVSQATAVVLGFVAIAGIYLGVADFVATKIVNFIL